MSNRQSELLAKARQQLEDKLPFVLYNKPNAEKLVGIFQRNDIVNTVSDFHEIGFVFAPFDGAEIVLIPENESEIVVADFEVETNLQSISMPNSFEDPNGKEDFVNLVQNGIAAIKKNQLRKVVLSRKEIVAIADFDAVDIFKRLLSEYPTAFTYCFFHPETGLWFGAFSEQLLKIDNNEFYTMAVAATQPFHEGEIIWENKEKEEQLFVTDFIVGSLAKVTSDLSVSEPYAMQAGKVVHIKTDIKAALNPEANLEEIIAILHPTPAVCGLPKEAAKAFILENEGYDRAYYSGFFGELNKDFANGNSSTDLYVNLRCMQINDKYAQLYVGCGVTKDSIPEKEWEETVNKSQTIKRILNNSN